VVNHHGRRVIMNPQLWLQPAPVAEVEVEAEPVRPERSVQLVAVLV